jgi:prepilin-type N-terminal cleavage/methylation domain-containing protein
MRRLERAPAPSEEGFTLVEVIVTVALISIAFVGILGAVGALVLSSVQNRNAASSEAVVRSAAAYTQSITSTPYLACNQAPLATYNISGVPLPAGFTASITDVQFWNGDSSPATFSLGPGCPPGGDQGLERVTVRVASPNNFGGGYTKTLTVLKRNSA